jgi:hypothetical protein
MGDVELRCQLVGGYKKRTEGMVTDMFSRVQLIFDVCDSCNEEYLTQEVGDDIARSRVGPRSASGQWVS